MTTTAETFPKDYFDTLSSEEKAVLTNCGIPLDIKAILEMEDEKFNEIINTDHKELSEEDHNTWLILSAKIKAGRKEIKDKQNKLWSTLEEEAKHNEWCGPNKGNGNGNGSGKARAKTKATVKEPESEVKDKDKEKRKTKEYYLQKYSGAEAILIGGRKPMFLQIINGNTVLTENIVFPDMILNPPDRLSYLSKEYSFESKEEIDNYVKRANDENLDSLYQRVKSIWQKYIDAEDFHISICAADTIFTYFQDKLGMTHYLLFVGDNDTGKSNNLTVFQYLAYRALFDTSITPANIYQFLGSIEEGQGIILEDEIDNIDQLQEKMKIYKVGYKAGVKISRMDTSSPAGRSQQSYWTFGFKGFTAEQQPDSIKGKGLNERLFVIKCSPGNPDYDIIEIINNADDEKYKLLFNELLDTRKLLLIYRLLHHNDPIPDISLNIRNRDKQLCKPLIRLFQGTNSTTAINDILSSLSKLLKEKKERKGNTLEARLYHIIRDLIQNNEGGSLDPDKITLDSATIWDKVREELEGQEIPGKPRSCDTGEYGIISSTKVVVILEDRFGADKGRSEKVRTLTFSINKLEKLARNYSFIDKIVIEPPNTEPTCHAQNDMSDMLRFNMSRSNDILPSTKGFSGVLDANAKAWWSCNYCNFETPNQNDYKHHTATRHPKKAGYPDKNGRTY